MTPAAPAWLAVLPGAAIAQSRGYLPQTVYAVAARANALACPSVGETGTIAAPAAVAGAVEDALRRYGADVEIGAIPLTPTRIFDLLAGTNRAR